jgi:hypothetical protein
MLEEYVEGGIHCACERDCLIHCQCPIHSNVRPSPIADDLGGTIAVLQRCRFGNLGNRDPDVSEALLYPSGAGKRFTNSHKNTTRSEG